MARVATAYSTISKESVEDPDPLDNWILECVLMCIKLLLLAFL